MAVHSWGKVSDPAEKEKEQGMLLPSPATRADLFISVTQLAKHSVLGNACGALAEVNGVYAGW